MKLHTTTTGDGTRRIALLHGVSGDHTIFEEFTDRLVGLGYTVIGVDLRGHGRSDRASSYQPQDFADDVVETLDAGLDVVAGHSLGASVLLDAVDRLRPARAIYLDPAFYVPETFDDEAMHANVGEHPDGTPYSYEQLAELNPHWGEANLRRAQATHGRWDAGMLPEITTTVGRRGAKELPTPPVPSLVLMGGASPLMPDFPRDAVERAGYEVRVQPDAGHNLHLDDPDATVAALQDWLIPR